ncbi:MAG: dephospho-CoA kinase [Planctomycetota bacterium]
MMFIVGLVGKIGAGKSTVARAMAELGAEVIDADRIAHEVLAEPEVVAAVVGRFGADVIDAAGVVRRPFLAEQVFGPTPAHDAALAALEAIVHPRVRERIEGRLAAIAAEESAAGRGVVVLDVPLLMQAGWDRRCDRLVRVECDEAERTRRVDRRGWPELQRRARERAWEHGYRSPPSEKTVVVDATGDPAYTRFQVGQVIESIRPGAVIRRGQ